MPPILTAQNLVRRISADRAHVDEPGAFGIRLEPAPPIVRRYGGQTRRAPGRRRTRRSARSPRVVVCGVEFFRKRRWLAAGSSFGMCQEAPNCRVVGERLKSTLFGHSASHSERLFLPHTCHSEYPFESAELGGYLPLAPGISTVRYPALNGASSTLPRFRA
jgi:hypothetical protein